MLLISHWQHIALSTLDEVRGRARCLPLLRGKVALTIVDGLQGCYDGGPAANPRYIYDAIVIVEDPQRNRLCAPPFAFPSARTVILPESASNR